MPTAPIAPIAQGHRGARGLCLVGNQQANSRSSRIEAVSTALSSHRRGGSSSPLVVAPRGGVLLSVTRSVQRLARIVRGRKSSTACSSGVALNVVAAPAIAPAISDLAASWVAGHPVVDGACPTVTVHNRERGHRGKRRWPSPTRPLPDGLDPGLVAVGAATAYRHRRAGPPTRRSLWVYPSIAQFAARPWRRPESCAGRTHVDRGVGVGRPC